MNKKILKNKYKKYETPQNMLFTVIDTKVLTKALNNTEMGLYIFLKAQSGRNNLKGKQLRLKISVGQIITAIGWRLGTKSINNMIQKLVQLKLIEIESKCGKTLEIVFLDDEKSLLNNGYFKVYAHSINAIANSSNGKQKLNYLGFYAYFRSTIFENTEESAVYDKSPLYLSKVCNMSYSNIRNYLQWMRENNILASFYVRAIRTESMCYNKYIYADMHDCQKLVKYIDDGRYGSVITEVLE